MRGGLVGYGTIAAGHLGAYSKVDGLEIVAVADSNAQRRALAKTQHPKIATHASLADMLKAERLEFVDICTPPSEHLALINTALDAGCHVLCEKPFLPNLQEFDALLTRHPSGQPIVYPSHNYKFSPIMRRLVRMVRAKEFGGLVRGYLRTMRHGHARGVPEWRPDWRRDFGFAAGGILQDHGTHSIYLSVHLCEELPLSVSCTLGNLRKDAFTGTEDTALVTLHFPNDVQIQIDLTWACTFRHTAYSLIGGRQNLIVENDNVISTSDGDVVRSHVHSDFDDPTHRAWFFDMLQDFRESIGDEHKQKQLLLEAWSACAAIQAGYQSAREGGRPVSMPSPPEALKIDGATP